MISCLLAGVTHATDYTIGTTSLTYNPDLLQVELGDRVTIQATTFHPTTQVSEATWNANGVSPLPGGFDDETSSFTIDITSLSTIYYVCVTHINQGMKGRIVVSLPTGAEESLNKAGFELVGNPVRDRLQYRMSNQDHDLAYMEIHNTSGQLMQEVTLYGSAGEAVIDLPDGMYLYTLRDTSGGLLAAGRLVVSR